MVQKAGPNHDEMYCSSCGEIVKKAAEICIHCGVRVSNEIASDGNSYSSKSRITAGILGILLGSIGVHRFYLGSIGVGIIQIITTVLTLGLAGLWGFIEGIILLAGGNFRDGKGNLLRKYH